MFRVFVKVHLHDFEAFRAYFHREGGAEERTAWGITQTQIHRTVSVPNEVTVAHDFDRLEDAKGYRHRSRLVDVMVEAGAAQVPQIWVTEVIV
jgi:hypothetical protein